MNSKHTRLFPRSYDALYIFNAAGISAGSRSLYQLDQKANVQAYVVQGEIVSVSQGLMGLRAEGTIRNLPAFYLPHVPIAPPQVRTATMAVNFGLSCYNHTMGAVLSKMGAK